MRGFCRCQHCGKFEINNLVYYNEQSLVPMQMCDKCLEEFNQAMSQVETAYDIPWWVEE